MIRLAIRQSIRLRKSCKPALCLADVIDDGHTVVITHGNGPQVGDLLVKNDLARDVVPAVAPLYWCVAQTQATIGMELAAAIASSSVLARGRNAFPSFRC